VVLLREFCVEPLIAETTNSWESSGGGWAGQQGNRLWCVRHTVDLTVDLGEARACACGYEELVATCNDRLTIIVTLCEEVGVRVNSPGPPCSITKATNLRPAGLVNPA